MDFQAGAPYMGQGLSKSIFTLALLDGMLVRHGLVPPGIPYYWKDDSRSWLLV